jgi:hypothetical protein
VDRGRVIHRLKGEILSSGIRIPGRKMRVEHPGRNSLCALEIRAVRDFVEDYFSSGSQAAFESVFGHASRIAELPPELLAFKVSQSEPVEDREPGQQRTRKARIEKQFRLSPGQSVIVGIAEDEQYVRYDPGTQGFAPGFAPALDTYRDEVFGRYRTDGDNLAESTLYRIAKAVLIHDRSQKKRQLLAEVLTGREDLSKLDELIAEAAGERIK